jgi:hypothetical protein
MTKSVKSESKNEKLLDVERRLRRETAKHHTKLKCDRVRMMSMKTMRSPRLMSLLNKRETSLVKKDDTHGSYT